MSSRAVVSSEGLSGGASKLTPTATGGSEVLAGYWHSQAAHDMAASPQQAIENGGEGRATLTQATLFHNQISEVVIHILLLDSSH